MLPLEYLVDSVGLTTDSEYACMGLCCKDLFFIFVIIIKNAF